MEAIWKRYSVLIIIAAIALLAFAWYWFSYRPAQLVVVDNTLPGPMANGAYDANDAAVTAQMLSLVQNSQFAGDLQWVLPYYPQFNIGGTNPPGSYSTMVINGQTIFPSCSRFDSLMWAVWSSSYTSNAQANPAPPVNGKTAAQAQAAANLLKQLATLWEQYKAATLAASI